MKLDRRELRRLILEEISTQLAEAPIAETDAQLDQLAEAAARLAFPGGDMISQIGRGVAKSAILEQIKENQRLVEPLRKAIQTSTGIDPVDAMLKIGRLLGIKLG